MSAVKASKPTVWVGYVDLTVIGAVRAVHRSGASASGAAISAP
jgi:hypothetical protein